MGFRAADYCVTIVALKKDEKKFGMTCAWMMQVDYDRLVCLIGSQSTTGSILEKKDRVGVSTLSKNQADVASFFGDNHSTQVDKFKNIEYEEKEGAICILGASREMFCEVIDIIRLEGIEEDAMLYLKILDVKENNEHFLHYQDLNK